MNLYSLPHEMERLNAAIEANEGEVTPEVELELAELAKAATDRIDPLCGWIRSLEAQAKAEKDEAAHFAARRKGHEGTATRLRKLILGALSALDVPKLKGSRFTASARKSTTPTIRWTGEGSPPQEFLRVTVEPNGEAILRAYREGRLPAGYEVTFSDWLDIR